MKVDQIIGLGLALITLATISVMIIYGDRTARVLGAMGNAFATSIRAATLRPR
jgi:hypothetical protein